MRSTLLIIVSVILSITSCQKEHSILENNLSVSLNTSKKSGGSTINLTQGLVAFYPFNGNANDVSVNGNNGTVDGAVLTKDRFNKPSRAYYFNGSATITGSANSFPSGNQARTISLWYNAETLGINGTIQLLGYGGGSCGTSFIMDFENPDIGLNRLGKIEVQGHCLNFWNYTNYPAPANNIWHNLIVVYDGSIIYFYNNGVLAFTSSSGISMNTNSLDKIFCFGRAVWPDGNTPYIDNVWSGFTGKLDDIRIYNRVLTQDEISYLAKN